jgi:hypothetical protein
MMDPDRLIGGLSMWIAPVAIATALVTGATLGLGPALLVLAGSVLLGVVALLWTSLGRLTGESPLSLEEALGLAAPSPEEERKRSLLRALKDLEYERSVGKIGDDDYRELSARYRADAKAVLKTLEEANAPRWKNAEQLLAARLKVEGVSAVAPPRSTSDAKTTDERAPEASEEGTATASCSSCGTRNDADARFCKRCGVVLGDAEGTP